MRALLFLLLWPGLVWAQSNVVSPGELALEVIVEPTPHTPVVGEMVMITIRGTYRRHITRETLVQPDLNGFSWAQLGPDDWREERLDGKLVKVFRRRMALYPDRAGRLQIGAFTHNLTLTDQGDDWFEHAITSAPVEITVDPAPAHRGWWFPVRNLQISDQWSNAPDQLQPGEGVLRIVRLEALGATPEMMPPMPDLTSPSAMIFPHPEKRLTELTSEGPVTYAFWRWTIRPSNDVSTIVEPLRFDYFNTRTRTAETVKITAQRVAYGTVTGARPAPAQVMSAVLPGWPVGVAGGALFVAGLWAGLAGRGLHLRRWPLFDPQARALRRAARTGDIPATRRSARALLRRDGSDPNRAALLQMLDRDVFDPQHPAPDLIGFARRFLASRAR